MKYKFKRKMDTQSRADHRMKFISEKKIDSMICGRRNWNDEIANGTETENESERTSSATTNKDSTDKLHEKSFEIFRHWNFNWISSLFFFFALLFSVYSSFFVDAASSDCSDVALSEFTKKILKFSFEHTKSTTAAAAIRHWAMKISRLIIFLNEISS